jgi:hypothetical protein
MGWTENRYILKMIELSLMRLFVLFNHLKKKSGNLRLATNKKNKGDSAAIKQWKTVTSVICWTGCLLTEDMPVVAFTFVRVKGSDFREFNSSPMKQRQWLLCSWNNKTIQLKASAFQQSSVTASLLGLKVPTSDQFKQCKWSRGNGCFVLATIKKWN